MSITNTSVANWPSGASSDSSVAVPGQSHISSGTTVLRRALSARAGQKGERAHSYVCRVTRVVISR